MNSFLAPVLLLLLCFSALQAQPSEKIIGKNIPAKAPLTAASKDPASESDQIFTRGDDTAKDRQALALLEGALPTNLGNYEVLWRTARIYYYVGDFAGKNEQLRFFEKGILVAQRAVALQPNAIEGHFWLAANYGGKAELVGVLKALSTVKKIRNEMQTVVKINDRFEDGNAYLALGEIERELPTVAGGDKKRSAAYLEQGLKIAPENMDLKISLAKTFKELGRKEESHRLLQEVLQATPKTRVQRDAQVEAKQLLLVK